MNYLPFTGDDCDSTQYKKYRSTCTGIMQQCTAELFLLNEPIALQLFNQLDNHICSYLSCEHHLDDLDSSVNFVHFSVYVSGF